MRLRPWFIRDRLTLWYVGIFGAVLGIYICGACILQYWQLSDQLHHAEIEDLETVEGLLYFTPDGRLLLHEDYHSHPQSRLLLDRYMEVLSPNGEVLFRNERLRGMYLAGAPTTTRRRDRLCINANPAGRRNTGPRESVISTSLRVSRY